MSKTIMLVIVLVAVMTVSCIADQLAWNSRGTCEEAAKNIKQDSILISYCSLCSNEHVEVWLVKGVIVAPTAMHGLFEVNVCGIRLYRSSEAFQENKYSEPVQYEAVTGEGSARWSITGIDLAYVYVPTSSGSFRCLGKLINRECSINVDTISLPYQFLEQAKTEVQRESRKMTLAWQ
ncbi:MAG: hypothetical protein U9Q94_06315 [Candidatus Bipolaricaulota bacterium]|nr:hypothetical protein [Candidatus Bipolaricaulota bacterium]